MPIVKSAASYRPYVQAQVRMYTGGVHVQVPGEEGNRMYGFAGTYPVAKEVAEFVRSAEAPLVSLADTGKRYVRAQVRPRRNCIHFQVFGEVTEQKPDWADRAAEILPPEIYAKIAPEVRTLGNRPYGLAFDIPRKGNEDFWAFLAEEILDAQ